MNSPLESTTRPWQRMGALGIVFAILYFIVALYLTGNEPGESASPAKLVKYYGDHQTSMTAAVFLAGVAMIVFAFFASSLRRALSRSGPDGGDLSVVVLIGAAVFIGAFLIDGLLLIALVHAGKDHAPAVAQTINQLSSVNWLPEVVGLSITALGTGVAALRNRTLPSWLAWASIVLGLMAIAGPVGAIAFLITPLWTIALGIVLIRRGAHEVAARPRCRSPPDPSAPLTGWTGGARYVGPARPPEVIANRLQ